MLTTEDVLNLDNINLDTSNNNSIEGHEDFLQQLSAELDIPLLLDQNGTILNFDSGDDILSEVMTSDSNWPQCDSLDTLDLDFTHMDTGSVPIKLEPGLPSSPESLYGETFNSHSPTPSQSSDGSRCSVEIKTEEQPVGFDTPPVSPQEKFRKFSPSSFKDSVTARLHLDFESSSVPTLEPLTKTPEPLRSNLEKLRCPSKRIPIQPKPPYSAPPFRSKHKKIAPSDNFVVKTDAEMPQVILSRVKTEPRVITTRNLNLNNGSGKVVVLENVPVQPPVLNKVAGLDNKVTQVVNLNPVQLNSVPVLYETEANLFALSSDFDAKVLKRQQRMIKNRESACLSRKKKKDYLMSLEKEVADLKLENQKLREENSQLRERLFGKSKGVSFALPNKASKNAAFLLAVLFMVTINVGSIRGLFNLNDKTAYDSDITLTSNSHHGRNLLWAVDQQIDSSTQTTNDGSHPPISGNISSDLPVCPMLHVNQSESVRLAEELHRWIAKPYNLTSALKMKKVRKYSVNGGDSEAEIRVPFSRAGRKLKRGVLQRENELQVFEPRPETVYSEFFEAINRRDDTFYVVSFNADNMLLPALHHNNTRRPKMSLLLPAMLPNESTSDHHSVISLMQIDCEVIDTRLLHVKSRSIPQHLRSAGNYTREDLDPVTTSDSNITSRDSNPDSGSDVSEDG